jgi:hypothetical protein
MHVVEDTAENIIPDGGHVIGQLCMFLESFHILPKGIGVLLCSPIKQGVNAIHPDGTLRISLAVEVFEHLLVQLEGIEAFLLCLANRNAPLLLSKEALLLPGFLPFTEYALLLHLPVF